MPRSKYKNKGHKRKIKPFTNLDGKYLKRIHQDGKLARRTARAVVHRAKNSVEVKLEEIRTKRLNEQRTAKAKKRAAKTQTGGITFGKL